MLLGTRHQTVGNTTQYFVDYWQALREGDKITAATVTTPSTDVTISNVAILEGHVVVFTIAGGILKEAFTVTVQATDSNSEVSNDTINFIMVGP